MPRATTAYETEARKVQGARRWLMLFALTVSHPVPYTWYLAGASEDNPVGTFSGGTFSGGTFSLAGKSYLGLVLDHSPAGVEAAVGGQAGGARMSLTLSNALGTMLPGGGGPMRRFLDWFADPLAPSGEPYDLESATLTVYRVFEGLTAADVETIGFYRLSPGGARAQGDRVELAFEEHNDLGATLPRRHVDRTIWVGASESAVGRPIPDVLGAKRIVPGLLVDVATGTYLFAESPSATPCQAIRRVLVQMDAPERGTPELHELVSPAANPVLTFQPTLTQTELLSTTECAQSIQLPSTMLISKVRLKLKAVNATTPGGRITVRIERDAAPGFPSGDLVDAVASADLDATQLTTVATVYDIPFPTLPAVPGGTKVWLTVRHANTPSGGQVHLIRSKGDASGAKGVDYVAAGDFATRSTADSEWSKGRVTVKRGAADDGFLIDRDACDPSFFETPVGQVAPRVFSFWGADPAVRFLGVGAILRCDYHTLGRSYLKFKISDLPATALLVQLRLFLLAKGTPSYPVVAYYIPDYGALTTADWDQTPRANLGQVLTPSTALNSEVILDVTSAYNDAKARGEANLAFMFILSPESLDPAGPADQYYGIGASEGSTPVAPSLSVAAEAVVSRYDMWHEVYATTFTPQASADDGTGNNVAKVSFGVSLGETRVIAGELDGIQDDASGTYGGAASALLTNGADQAYWLAKAQIALGLADARIDRPAFLTARQRLADWFALAGVVFEEQTAEVWLNRLARCGKSAVFQDQEGRVTIYTDGLGQSYVAEVIGTAPLTYWRLGEAAGATTAKDEMGVQAGTYAGSPSLGAAGAIIRDPNGAMSCDGVDDEMTAPSGFHDFGSGSWSIACWFLSDFSVDAGALWGKGSSPFNLNGTGIELRVRTASTLIEFARATGSGTAIRLQVSGVAANAWHCVVVLYDVIAQEARLYLDGVLRGSQAYSGTYTDSYTFKAGHGQSALFAGTLDDLAVYATATKTILTPAEITRLWEVGHQGHAARRLIQPWDHGELTMAPLSDRAAGYPWTRVFAYYARDLLARENPPGSLSRAAEWDGFAVIGAPQTSPADATRQAQAVTLEARYGVRTNGDPSGQPAESNTFYFVPEDQPSGVPAKELLNWLWDRAAQRPDMFELVDVALPRAFADLRLMDEVVLESYDFPSRCARAFLDTSGNPTPLRWKGKTFEGGRRKLYRCRRGLFSIRALDGTAAPGGELPVRATLRLVGWSAG
jgi:hypothetical protein